MRRPETPLPRLLIMLLSLALLPGCVVAAGTGPGHGYGYGYGYARPYYAPPAVIYRPAPVYRPYFARPHYGRPYGHGRPGWGHPRHPGW